MAYVRKEGPGRYRVRFHGPDGKLRSETFTKRADADRRARNVDAEVERGEWIDRRDGRVTLASFYVDEYRKTMVGLEATTRARDESYWRTHIEPTFGRAPLSSIDYTACQAWVAELSTRKAPATTVKAAQILGKILKVAVRARRITHNPMAEVELPTVEDPDDVFLTPQQVETLADAMTEAATVRSQTKGRGGNQLRWPAADSYRALVWLGCYGGPRIGELLALRWTDLDALRGTVTISRKVVEVSGLGQVEGSTKTRAGRRTVPLPRGVVAELERHREQFGGDGLIFKGPRGEQVRANNLRRREWAAAVRLAGLDAVVPVGGDEPRALTFHDMRHTAVSLWVAADATDLQVARWAGHRTAAFTKSRYAHLFPEHGDSVRDRLDAFIATSTPTPAARVVSIGRR